MPRGQHPAAFKPGHKKLGGRKKGTPNKATTELKAIFREILEDPKGIEKLRQQFRAGLLPPQTFTLMCYYVMGKPTDTLAIEKLPPILVVDELDEG